MTPVWLFAFVVAAAPNPHLPTAEDHVAQVRYPEAEKALAQARAHPGNSREALLRILQLQGIVAATLGQAPKASKHFQQMLMLDPERKLPDGLPPRVRTPFYEAKGMASEAKQMAFSSSAETTPEGPVLRAQLSADPMNLVRRARFHVREQGGAWKVTHVPLVTGVATHSPGPGRFEWWVDLLGEHDAVLFSGGSEARPNVDGMERAAPKKPEPVAVVPAPPADSPHIDLPRPAPEPASSGVSPAVWVLLGGAVAVAAGGTVAGVLSRGNASKIENASKDSNGFVSGMTQREAGALRDQAKTQAIAANVLFGSAIALAGAGAAIWLFSGPSSSVAVLPSPTGVVFAGEFP